MNGEKTLTWLRRLCRDLDAGAVPTAPSWARALDPGVVSLTLALGLAGPGCGAEQHEPSPRQETPPALAEAGPADAGAADSGESTGGDRPPEAGPSGEPEAEPAPVQPAEAGPPARDRATRTQTVPRIRLGEATVLYGAGFSREVVRRVVLRRRAELADCARPWTAAHAGEPARVVLRFRIGADGGAEDVRVEPATALGGEVEGCLRRVVEGLVFPRPEGGELVVTYPLVFEEGGGGER